MRPILRALLVLVPMALLLLAAACGDDGESPQADDATPAATEPAAETSEPAAGLTLTSSAFENGAAVPVQYTCDGDSRLSPPLAISGVPDGAVSLALIVDDIDGPGGSFIHWTVFNIDPATADVPEGTVPGGGILGQTSAGEGGYFGPCPPTGTHRYVFMLYALDAELDLDAATAGRDEIDAAMDGHILDSTELTGTYSRAADSSG